jgi:hypothetical protein
MSDQACDLLPSLQAPRANARAAASDTGYIFENAPMRPRLGMKANVTSALPLI